MGYRHVSRQQIKLTNSHSLHQYITLSFYPPPPPPPPPLQYNNELLHKATNSPPSTFSLYKFRISLFSPPPIPRLRPLLPAAGAPVPEEMEEARGSCSFPEDCCYSVLQLATDARLSVCCYRFGSRRRLFTLLPPQ